MLAIVLPGVICLAEPPAPAQPVERVSVSAEGEEGDGFSFMPWPSFDGRYVAFESEARSLVPDDDNCVADAFVCDRKARTVERVSLAGDGSEGNGASQRVRISADGRFVVFQSAADNLVPGDNNAVTDVFVHDRWTRCTRRASEGAFGEEGAGPSIHPKISADGRFVAFHSQADNWVAHDNNHQWDVYVRDLQTGDMELVSVRSDGAVGNDWSEHCSVSGDGRYVAYHSKASNLVEGDANGKDDIFLFDRQRREVRRVSVNAVGQEGNGASAYPALSDDGGFLGFESDADNLTPDDRNGKRDIFLYEIATGALRRISQPSTGQSDGDSMRCALSADGRRVVYFSHARNLVDGDANNTVDVFLWDAGDGATRLVSAGADGSAACGASQFPILSGDGCVVAFHTFAADLVPDDRNMAPDILVRAVCDPP